MSRIDDDSVSTSIDKSLHTIERINSHTNTCSYTQTSFLILTSHGFVLGFRNILIRNQAYQTVVLINDRQFLDLILLKNLCSCHQVGLLVGRHKIILRHNLLNGTIQTTLKAQVTVSNDAHEVLLIIHHGDTANMILRHDVERLGHS